MKDEFALTSSSAKTSGPDIVEREPIAAIATPLGEGGIAVIRISGRNSIRKVNEAFRGRDLTRQPSHTVHFGSIVDASGRVVDEVLATLFHSPRSYTGEETVEISCHGGVLVTQAVLEAILSLDIRAAEPGEFTQRAFLNGKMELSQAEAVADLIHAKSRKAMDAAHQQLEGRLGEHIRQFRQQIIDATAMVELELDFVEEDVEFANIGQLQRLLKALEEEIEELLATYETGRLVKHGVRTVLIGLPNAGKSTLLNTLVGKDRAIVTAIAGTTRDTIDVDWSYDGILFRLTDTAGLRETTDAVEAEGVKRSQKAFAEADLAVYLKDLSQQLSAEEREDIALLQRQAGDTPFILVGTKSDVAVCVEDERLEYDLKISALECEKIEELKKLMKQRALENKHYDASSLLVTSSRHRDALQKARRHVQSAIRALEQGMTGDFLSIDLRAALKELGTITGEITTEDVLDSIFSRFCIGK
jgi:tRNA modification GTPase